MSLPKRYRPHEVESRWREHWRRRALYRFDPERSGPVFSIDTPPPTVSGELHIGHVFSYTHTDLVARFQRMRGRNVFYPMGWDDNGLPTERRVQNLLNVRCDPALPYDPDFAPDPAADELTPVSRRNFLELCAQVTARDEEAFKDLWQRLGLSVDWSQTYATIDERSRRLSQALFLDLVRKGEAYCADAPTTWDVDFQTAVAQAETEEREIQGREFLLRFGLRGGGTLRVMTTRPELLAACVAVIVHPDDTRYASLVGRTAVTPGYRAPVPVLSHPLAEPGKGTGAVMVCTFGDATDVTWWRELDLPTRLLLGRDGRIQPVEWGSEAWPSLDPTAAARVHARLEGLTAAEAKAQMARILCEPAPAADGSDTAPLEGEPRPLTQQARFYERGERPLEILTTRQWFVRLLDKRDALIRQGRKVRWHPEHMRVRYERWVEGLKYDWCVSRQRYHGVPIPLWYPLDGGGKADYERPLLPADDRLPVEPMSEAPDGFSEAQRGQPGGFTAETDVLDTWATSSLTPQIATGRGRDDDLHERLYPMDLRPQAHDIIRTWAFYTIARAYMLDGRTPWRHIALSGWVVDPNREKMSKSRGNVVTPQAVIGRYGTDAVRYWAASARLGADTAYDESVFEIGNRLVTKLFNAGKLVVSRLRAAPEEGEGVTAPLDRAHLALLAKVVRETTALMDDMDTAGALARVEDWFWHDLCDNYLELTKGRAYGGDGSALATWDLSLATALRLFAPFLPYVTEEVWSWMPGRSGSVHGAPWPEADEPPTHGADADVFRVAVEVLAEIRRAKTAAQVSLRSPVAHLCIRGPADRLARLERAMADVVDAGAVQEAELHVEATTGLTVDVRLPAE